MAAFDSETPTRNQKTSAFHSQYFPCGRRGRRGLVHVRMHGDFAEVADYGGPVGTLGQERSFSAAPERCNPALVPAHRLGRKLGPTPPTIKLDDVEGVLRWKSVSPSSSTGKGFYSEGLPLSDVTVCREQGRTSGYVRQWRWRGV